MHGRHPVPWPCLQWWPVPSAWVLLRAASPVTWLCTSPCAGHLVTTSAWAGGVPLPDVALYMSHHTMHWPSPDLVILGGPQRLQGPRGPWFRVLSGRCEKYRLPDPARPTGLEPRGVTLENRHFLVSLQSHLPGPCSPSWFLPCFRQYRKN